MTARLQIVQCGHRQHGGSRWTSSRYLLLISAYAPTAKAPLGIRAKFVDNLQGALDSLPSDNIVIVLGDFNPRVGKWKTEDYVWKEVREFHGIGTCNEAEE